MDEIKVRTRPFGTLCSVLVLLATMLFFSKIGHAQLTTGAISGTVVDASGAVVPGASIRIRNLATGITVSSITNSDGLVMCVIPTLQAPPLIGQREGWATRSYKPGFSLSRGSLPCANRCFACGVLRNEVFCPKPSKVT